METTNDVYAEVGTDYRPGDRVQFGGEPVTLDVLLTKKAGRHPYGPVWAATGEVSGVVRLATEAHMSPFSDGAPATPSAS